MRGEDFLNTIFNEDCLTGIAKLPDNSIDLIVTSPEYYGAPMWENKISYTDYLTFQEKVIDQCIRVCKDGGFIIYNVDPFMGSGTTGLACKQTGRFYVGYENDKTRCDYAINRIASKLF